VPLSGLKQNKLCLFPQCLSVSTPSRFCPFPLKPLSGLMENARENADYAGFLYANFRAPGATQYGLSCKSQIHLKKY
jgi:hypothetical protein